jgi:hypothetical protein
MSTEIAKQSEGPAEIGELANRAMLALAAQGGINPDLPAHLQGGAIGTEDFGAYVKPPQLKVVQKQSASELLTQFDPGTVVTMPQRVLVSPMQKDEKTGRNTENGERFAFVPLFFYPEYCFWEPNGVKPAIIDRTLDSRTQLAMLCKNRTKVAHPTIPGQFRNYVEHLNFVVLLLNNASYETTLMLLTFSRGEHSRGTAFMGLMQMRRHPMFGGQFVAQVHGPSSGRKNEKGEWYGIDVENPNADDDLSAYVQDVTKFSQYGQIHEWLKAQHKAGLIVADYEDGEDQEANPHTTGAGGRSDF